MGWKNESARHSLSVRGIKTKTIFKTPKYIPTGWYHGLKVGTIIDEDDIEMDIIVSLKEYKYGSSGSVKTAEVTGVPTKKGKDSDAYYLKRHEIGDDFTTDYTNTWFDLDTFNEKLRDKINEASDEVRKW